MKAPRVVVFGVSSFTRASIPEILADFGSLPSVDDSAFDGNPAVKIAYQRNLEAFRLFVEEQDLTLKDIQHQTTIHPKQLYRLLDRVVSKASDGRIQGLRGLIPGKHLKEYERVMTVKASSKLRTSSAAGAMQQLLRCYPTLQKWISKSVRLRKKPLREGEIRAVKRSVRLLHSDFLEECERVGITLSEYPFNQDLRGLRSFQGIVRRLEREHQDAHPKAGDNQPKVEATPDYEKSAWPIALNPFMVVQFDGHKIDVRLTLVIPDPFGMETIIELHRIWILVVTDVLTKAALGYYLALGLEYNKDDFAEAIQAAIVPHRKVTLTIPGLAVRNGGGFPTEVQPELAYHRWSWLQFDEAKSHLSTDSLTRLTKVLGTWTIAGRLGEPNDRSYQERFFGLIEQCFHQVPGTLGSNPKDDVRRLGDVGKDLSRLISLDELEQLAYVVVANRNGETQSGLGGRTSLEAMRYLTSKPEFMLQTLPATKRHQLFLLKEAVIKVIRGAKSVPHVNFEDVRYTSDILAQRPELVGKTVRIYYMARDIRRIHAFFEDGAELGILVASRQWRTTPHSIRLRKEIFRLQRLGSIHWGANDDPIEVFMRYKRVEAKQSKRAANSVAKARAGIAAAEMDVAHGDSPFDKKNISEIEQASTNAPEAKRIPTRKRRVSPTPISLTKTVIF